jgi:hypothetical protein
MKKSHIFGFIAAVVVSLGVLAGSAHAAAGEGPHEAGECVACDLCAWIHDLVH